MEVLYLVGRGRISGTYADGFHCVCPDGRLKNLLGPGSRPFRPGEREQVLTDIKRHREKLLSELADLENAEKVLSK